MTRPDIRLRVRDYLNEEAEELWTDDQLNRYLVEELRSLPSKDIYLEELWTTPVDADEEDVDLPDGTFKVESTEIDRTNSSPHNWVPLSGVDNYAGALYLPFVPTGNETLRIKIKKYFTEPVDDDSTLDIPDDKSEVLVWGMVIRAYNQLIGYYRKNVSWDAVTKPGSITLSVIQGWLRDAKTEQNNLLRQYSTVPRPRDIDLTS